MLKATRKHIILKLKQVNEDTSNKTFKNSKLLIPSQFNEIKTRIDYKKYGYVVAIHPDVSAKLNLIVGQKVAYIDRSNREFKYNDVLYASVAIDYINAIYDEIENDETRKLNNGR